MGSTLSTDIVDRIRGEILKGTMLPGVRLSPDDLRTRYDVSLTPVREALMRLAAEGLVVAEDQRGFRVAPVSRENLIEVSELRRSLECLALRHAIERGDLEWETAIVAAQHRLAALTSRRRGDKPEINDQWEQCHRAYHMALISSCGMPLLLNFCRTLHDMSDRYRRMFLTTTRQVDRSREHEMIANAARERDVERAVKLLDKHITFTETLVLDAYDAATGKTGERKKVR
jgi:GntR family carbon starvation induced transcriptional regulator